MFPPTCSILDICPSVQRDGQLRTVLKALTKSPIAEEVKDLLTLLEQHDAQSTCYASGSNKISQRWTRGRAFFALGCLFGGQGSISGKRKILNKTKIKNAVFPGHHLCRFINACLAFVCTCSACAPRLIHVLKMP